MVFDGTKLSLLHCPAEATRQWPPGLFHQGRVRSLQPCTLTWSVDVFNRNSQGQHVDDNGAVCLGGRVRLKGEGLHVHRSASVECTTLLETGRPVILSRRVLAEAAPLGD